MPTTRTPTSGSATEVSLLLLPTVVLASDLALLLAGHIHYFDATLSDSKGDPYTVEKAVCMHEEDDGILWKHMEYRTGHAQSRRSRKLVLSFIATVVNYEYLFYWYCKQVSTVSR